MNLDNTDKDKENLSRKEFLAITGRSVAVGAAGTLSLAGLLQNDAFGQTSNKAMSPPAAIPPGDEEPIVLEAWKSDVDQQSGPTPTPLPPDRRVRYAVVGLGHLALEEIIPALFACKKSKLTALVSDSPEKMQKVARQYGIKAENCYTYQTYDKLKDNMEVDVIYIVLPNSLHKEYVIRGAKAGKHILCEKPMAISAKECEEMIAACNKANVKLMVAYRIQYQPHNRKLRDLVKDKTFGVPKFVEACNSQSSANPAHWRHKIALAGGGALPDIGLYCLNTTRFILGEEPTEVFAYQYSTPGNPLFTEVEELVSWQMRFPSGVIANCSTDYNVHESRRYRVMCDRGWLNMDKAYAYKGQKLTTAKADGKMEKQEEIGLAEINQFGAEMDHFSECILKNKRPFTPGEEGLQDHIIMEAIYKSAKEGKPAKIVKRADANTHGPEPVVT
ncbi:Gfo/Idh/MocA family oxidoreductase [Mucilaginibacter pallidiroseus]|uniref:Gfo/Idh/MocA family oxidoreductase n=1 Tax=Mucilaginibacter pallidiroseus TaxID=2599295 RepID=A0A563UJP4_9SPHI|nr:Gfo/Idh/MocA family oxidoreductase [Mucilaginibacter pallidiroseus]TWR31543.1 Gfo/Idh/MocA family oxidoreductase [Mucilaginibacter pallidiroseus]